MMGGFNTSIKIIATESLLPTYLKKLRRHNRLATAVALLMTIFSLSLLLLHIGAYALLSSTLCILAALIGTSWAWTTAYHARRGAVQFDSGYQLAWLLIGLGLLADGVGRAYVTFLAYSTPFNPAPSLADIGFTLFYPFLFAGLVLMLIRPRITLTCVKMGFDALITTLCILGVSWYFFIAPTFLIPAHVPAATLLTALSYPFWDILLILAILMIIHRCAEHLLHPSLLLCGAGLIAAVLADTASTHFTAFAMYSSTIFVDPLRVMSAMLIGLSALYQYTALARASHIRSPSITARKEGAASGRHETSPRRFILFQGVLLYLPLSILLALTLGSDVSHDEERTLFLVVLTIVVSLLVAVHYLLTLYENELLLREQERQRREAERLYLQIHAAHQRLQELDQLKDQFMMTASHELRTPLVCVHGYLELLTQFHDLVPPERHQDILQKAQCSCTELMMLINNIMDASYLEVAAGIHSLHLESVPVQDMIQSIIDLIEPHVIQEQREVQLNIPPDLVAQADAGRLRQVLLNISVNALKYSPPGTPLTFSARPTTDAGQGVVISVADKGKGISPQDQARLFQRFVRLERDMNSPIRGSGLGLYISRCLIEGMSGKIWIESTGIPGEGTTVHIQLPRHISEKEQAACKEGEQIP